MKFRGFLHVLLAAACLLAPVGAAAQNVKISAMPAASALDGTELYAGVQGGANVKITGAQVKTLTSASPTLVTPNLGTPSAGVMTNVTGTAAGLTAGNASQLLSATWAAPGTIGSTTPATGAFTTLSATGKVTTAATALGGAGLILPHGTAPSSPVNGDVWTTTAGIFAQINGSTVGPLSAGGGGTPGGSNTQLQYNNSSAFGGAAGLTTNGTDLTLGSSSLLNWSTDLKLSREAAATLSLVDGVNAQQANIYNTSSSANANYERATIGWKDTANTLVVATRAAGTGTARSITLSSAASMFFQANGSAGPFWTLNTTGFWSPSTDNAYDIGLSAGNQPRTIYAKTNIQSPIFTSTVSTGTAPFTVTSTTQVTNLNASQLIGGTWAIPGSIGATTPNAGAFTSLTASTTANVTGILTTQSGQVVKLRVVTASGAVTVATTDDIVVMKKTVPATTVINLPSSPTTGQRFTFKDGQGDWASFNVTLTPAAGTIDGAATKVGNINWQSFTVVYDGTQWEII